MQPITLDYMQFGKDLRIRAGEKNKQVFDPIRKRWLVLQPEELLRQLVLQYLISEKKYSPSRIRSEQQVMVNGRPKRADIIVYNTALQPWLLVECKSPKVRVDLTTFEQVAMYNMVLGVEFIAVTNGLATFVCAIDQTQKSYQFLGDFPDVLQP